VSWDFWIIIGLYAATGIAVFGGRNLLKAWVERGVEYRFNSRLEELRADLRRSEEELKSQLRIKETEITALRDGILSGRTQRQALVDKRRIEAVEKLWGGIVALSPYEGLSAAMATLNVDALAKRSDDPKIQQFTEIVSAAVKRDPEALSNNPAKNDRPFVSALAWAYFFAYLTIVSIAFASMKLAEIGTQDLSELFAKESIRNFIKAALPHRSEFIDRNEPNAYYYLRDEIKLNLLTELQKILREEDQDAAGIEQAARIMEMARKLSQEPTTAVAGAVAAASAPGH
jgi:hypothetical protein